MNAYTIYLKSGTPITIYTPRKLETWDECQSQINKPMAGCPIRQATREHCILDLTLNQKNQLKWLKEQKELMANLREFDSGISQQAFEVVAQKLMVEQRVKMEAANAEGKMWVPER
jgi:hypothetical protein